MGQDEGTRQFRKRYTTENGKWTIWVVRRPLKHHLTGWLVNNQSGNRYVWSCVNGNFSYMREYKPPTNIPIYVKDFVQDTAKELMDEFGIH